MLKIIVESGRYDKDFVENYTAGFEEFANYLRTVNLKKMSYDSGVSEETMHKISDIFCSTTKISLVSYTGLEYQLSGVQNNRAIQILWAITGKIDVPGGTFYIGFDPTADSLHVGHFIQIMVMMHMQRAGHRPIAILGSGTGMVGDPSVRTDMRKMLTVEEIEHNVNAFKGQLSRFIDFSEGKALLLSNGDWLRQLNYIELLRDIGVHFSVNRMLSFECFKSRYERGLSFIEFNYMIMQAYDFLYLNRHYNCKLQFGGNDQWSNIIAGVELIRRADSNPAYGLTFKLLTNSEGKKMGKTSNGAVWLDPQKTTPFDFYQYWRTFRKMRR